MKKRRFVFTIMVSGGRRGQGKGEVCMGKTRLWTLGLCGVVVVMVFAGCASLGVKTKGAEYFVGKTEADLIKYFDQEGVAFEIEEDHDFDSLLYFTNVIVQKNMSKTTQQTYKTSSSTQVFNLGVMEYSDGCLLATQTNTLHYDLSSYNSNSYVHRNDNNYVNSQIRHFEDEVARLAAVPVNDQDTVFKNTSPGSWYFTYRIQQSDYYYDPGYIGWRTNSSYGSQVSIPAENVPVYYYQIYKVDVYNDTKTSTETHVAFIYNEAEDLFYDKNSQTISVEQAVDNEWMYLDQGFSAEIKTKGLALTACIRNGIVEAVYDMTDAVIEGFQH